tara:strand:+ start:147 stop:308 length:162 start_codon:yes stop_codon:yes gene_type:complete
MKPFTIYRLGYIDGYEGNPLRSKKLSKDNNYVVGYEEGKGDDSLGKPNKFKED